MTDAGTGLSSAANPCDAPAAGLAAMTDPLRRHAERAGFALVSANLVFDAERDRPRLVRAVARRCPPIRAILAGLRRRLPLARNAGAGIAGQFYRLPGHYRRVCCAIPDLAGPEHLWQGDVVAIEGSELLMADFDDYLRWMLTTPLRDGDLPIGLHLPLVAGAPPGAAALDECLQAQRQAAALHERHLDLYGEPAQAPVPLAVHRCSAGDTARYVETLRWHLPRPAFERAEACARAGCGVSVWYCPAAPICVDDLQRLAAADPHLRPGPEAGEETIAGWCRQFARLLHLGFMPFAPWNAGRGSCVDAGSACLDGGFADLSALVPFESMPDDGWFRRSLLDSIERLSHTVSVFTASLGPGPAGPLDPHRGARRRAALVPRLLEHLEREKPGGDALDARVSSGFRLARRTPTCGTLPRPGGREAKRSGRPSHLEDRSVPETAAPSQFRPYRPGRTGG